MNIAHAIEASDEKRVDEFYALLHAYPNLTWVAPSLGIADAAARIRAVHNLRTADALQAATAIASQVTGLVTNDLLFRRVLQFETLVLEDVVVS